MIRVPPQDVHNVAVINTPNAISPRDPKRYQILSVIPLDLLQPVSSPFGQAPEFYPVTPMFPERVQIQLFKLVEFFHDLLVLGGVIELTPRPRPAFVMVAETPRQRPSLYGKILRERLFLWGGLFFGPWAFMPAGLLLTTSQGITG